MTEKRKKNPLAIRMGRRMARQRRRLRGPDGGKVEQPDIARKAGLSVEAYGSYERGWHVAPTKHLAAIAKALDTTVDYLLGLPDPCDLNDDTRTLVEVYQDIETSDIRQNLLALAFQQRALDQRLRGASPVPSPPEHAE